VITKIINTELKRLQRKKKDIKLLLEAIKTEQPSKSEGLTEFIADRMPAIIKYHSQLESILEQEQFIERLKQEL